MIITILTDNPDSWIIPYVEQIKEKLQNHDLLHIFDKKDIIKGDVLFLLSCEKLISKEDLALNTNNIVVHPSPLPKYRGWSPLAYQIIDGLDEIVVSLFEAEAGVDSGVIYLQQSIKLDGSELNEELKRKQGEATVSLVLEYIPRRHHYGTPQTGTPTYCQKKTLESSEISPHESIIKQFNLFRVADNERYPIFFKLHGKKYILKIYEDDQA